MSICDNCLHQEVCGNEGCGDEALTYCSDFHPVKHGRWKYTEAYPHWMFCDQCYKRIVPNKEWIKEYNIPTNYCPNCGAKMDMEKK